MWVRLICGTAERGICETALVEPTEPKEMTIFITTTIIF